MLIRRSSSAGSGGVQHETPWRPSGPTGGCNCERRAPVPYEPPPRRPSTPSGRGRSRLVAQSSEPPATLYSYIQGITTSPVNVSLSHSPSARRSGRARADGSRSPEPPATLYRYIAGLSGSPPASPAAAPPPAAPGPPSPASRRSRSPEPPASPFGDSFLGDAGRLSVSPPASPSPPPRPVPPRPSPPASRRSSAPEPKPDFCDWVAAGAAEALRKTGGGWEAPCGEYGRHERRWLARHAGFQTFIALVRRPGAVPTVDEIIQILRFFVVHWSKIADGLRHGPPHGPRSHREVEDEAQRRRIAELDDRVAKAKAVLARLREAGATGAGPFADAAEPEVLAATDELLRPRREAPPAPRHEEWRRLLPAWQAFVAARTDPRLALTAGEYAEALRAACALWRLAAFEEEGSEAGAAAARGTGSAEAAFLHARRAGRIRAALEAAESAVARARALEPAKRVAPDEADRFHAVLDAAERGRLEREWPPSTGPLTLEELGEEAKNEYDEASGTFDEAVMCEGAPHAAFDRGAVLSPGEYGDALHYCVAHWAARPGEAGGVRTMEALAALQRLRPGGRARPPKSEEERRETLRAADAAVAAAAADLAARGPPPGETGETRSDRRLFERFVADWRAPWARLSPAAADAALAFAPLFWRARLALLEREARAGGPSEGEARRAREARLAEVRERLREAEELQGPREAWPGPGAREAAARREAAALDLLEAYLETDYAPVVSQALRSEARARPEGAAASDASNAAAREQRGAELRERWEAAAPFLAFAQAVRGDPRRAQHAAALAAPLRFLAAHCRRSALVTREAPGPVAAPRVEEAVGFYEARARLAERLAREAEQEAARVVVAAGQPPAAEPRPLFEPGGADPSPRASVAAEAERLAAGQLTLLRDPALAF